LRPRRAGDPVERLLAIGLRFLARDVALQDVAAIVDDARDEPAARLGR
jgi:hypothetical protein